jgi:hypothetical protein
MIRRARPSISLEQNTLGFRIFDYGSLLRAVLTLLLLEMRRRRSSGESLETGGRALEVGGSNED